jgi:hypothetical protein
MENANMDNDSSQTQSGLGEPYRVEPTTTGFDQFETPTTTLVPTPTTEPATAAAEPATLTSQIKDRAAAAVSEKKDGLADRIEDLARTVHNSGDQFAGKQDWVAGAIERGATELGALATSLRENDLSSLLTQVSTLARKQPALFIGASFVAGFAVARIGKMVASDVSREDLPTLPEVGHANN